MGFTTDPQTKTPTTVAAQQYSQKVTCDLDLQSLIDAITTLTHQIAATGEGDMRTVSLNYTVLTNVLNNETGLTITATWTV